MLSLSIFKSYTDLLNILLNKKKIRCIIGSQLINHIYEADDMVLLCSSLSSLQELVEVCEDFAAQHGIIYNVNKTEYTVF